MEQDAVHIGFEAAVAAYNWKKIGGKNRQLDTGEQFCINLSTRKTISVNGGHDSVCTDVTSHSVEIFRVSLTNSNIERNRRSIKLFVFLLKANWKGQGHEIGKNLIKPKQSHSR